MTVSISCLYMRHRWFFFLPKTCLFFASLQMLRLKLCIRLLPVPLGHQDASSASSVAEFPWCTVRGAALPSSPLPAVGLAALATTCLLSWERVVPVVFISLPCSHSLIVSLMFLFFLLFPFPRGEACAFFNKAEILFKPLCAFFLLVREVLLLKL